MDRFQHCESILKIDINMSLFHVQVYVLIIKQTQWNSWILDHVTEITLCPRQRVFKTIYVKVCRILTLSRTPTFPVARNTVEGVRFIITTVGCSVLVAVWHYECHQLIKEIRKSSGNYNLRCKYCWYEWTESWHPSMTKQDKPSPK